MKKKIILNYFWKDLKLIDKTLQLGFTFEAAIKHAAQFLQRLGAQPSGTLSGSCHQWGPIKGTWNPSSNMVQTAVRRILNRTPVIPRSPSLWDRLSIFSFPINQNCSPYLRCVFTPCLLRQIDFRLESLNKTHYILDSYYSLTI